MEDSSMLGAVLAILQWWGPNVTVVSMNKWLFQVKSISLSPFCSFFVCFFLRCGDFVPLSLFW
ncbi:unnamed protein product [Musa acuminata subsp. malaccensis]|uniref:(wild Malaysian banana) hypothetical protein n=1 Tax=Musa acuminata subsp. malaccensis TaxID=214687 RepID=A0A804L7G6_MUSAM|nr:unnamed protein product [Musa acuminata subsp. malaccensis]